MSDERLLTVVQASDLHFGDDPRGSSQPSPPPLAFFPWFRGWLDHHFQAVSDLHEAWIEILDERTDEKLAFVLSGDLTANGAVQQFALAADFLGSTPSPNAFGMSLGLVDWADSAVLGNHDRWPGTNRVLGQPALHPNPHVPGPFPRHRTITLPGGETIRFVFADSDADVHPLRYDRFFGRGRFETQLDRLRRDLPPVERGEVRVLVIHHAIADHAVQVSANPVPFPQWSMATQWRALKIEGRSLRALETFLVEAEIDVVLTGHLHSPRLTEMTAQAGSRRRRVFEARCGTTTQQDDAALGARLAGWPWHPALEPNTFLLHELVRRAGRLVWVTEVRRRSDADGFKGVLGGASAHPSAALRREFEI